MFNRLKPYMICILKPCDDDTDIAIGDIHYKIENTIFFDDPELCLDKQEELIESGKMSIILNAFSIQHEMIVNERFCVQQECGIDDVNYEVKQ